MGRRERDRIRALEPYASTVEPRPEEWKDEIVAERGVKLLPERGGVLHDVFCRLMATDVGIQNLRAVVFPYTLRR